MIDGDRVVIAADDHHVGQLGGLNRSELIAGAECHRGVRGRRAQRLKRRQSRLDEFLELGVQAQSVWHIRRAASGHDPAAAGTDRAIVVLDGLSATSARCISSGRLRAKSAWRR
jgi:hypothetical protein